MRGMRFVSMAMICFLGLLCALSLPASAGVAVGPGASFAAFYGEGGRLDRIDGLAATLRFEIPIGEGETVRNEDGTRELTFSKSLYLGVPVISDQDALLWSFDVQYAQQFARSDIWWLFGTQFSFPQASLLARLDTRDPIPAGDEIENAIFIGPKLGFYATVPIAEDKAIPIEVQASLDFHVAGIPQELDAPKILRFDIIVPQDLF